MLSSFAARLSRQCTLSEGVLTTQKKASVTAVGGLDGGLLWLVLCVGGKSRLRSGRHVRAAVTLPARLGLVCADRALLSVTDQGQLRVGNSHGSQEFLDGFGAAIAQRQVVF